MPRTAGPTFKCKQICRRINAKKSRRCKTVINNFYIGNQFLNIKISNTNINQCSDNFHFENDSYKESRFSQSPVQSKPVPDALLCGNQFKLFPSSNDKLNNLMLSQETKTELLDRRSPIPDETQPVIAKSGKLISPYSSSLFSSDSSSCMTLSPLKDSNKFHLDKKLDTKITLAKNVNLSSTNTSINGKIKDIGIKEMQNSSTASINALNYLFLNSPPQVLCALGKLIQTDSREKRKKLKKNINYKSLHVKCSPEKNIPRKMLPPAGNDLLSSSGTSTPFCNKESGKRNWEISPIVNFSIPGKSDWEEEWEELSNSEKLTSTFNDDILASPTNVAKHISKLVLDNNDDKNRLSTCNERQSFNHNSGMKSCSRVFGQIDFKSPFLGSNKYLSDEKRKSNYSDDIFESISSPSEAKSECFNKECQLQKLSPEILSSNSSDSCQQEEKVIAEKGEDDIGGKGGDNVGVEKDPLYRSNDHYQHDKTSISSSCDFLSTKSYSRFDNSIDSDNSFNFSFTHVCPGEAHEEKTSQVLGSQSNNSCLEQYFKIIPGKKWRRSLLVAAKTLVSVKNSQKVASKTSRNMRFSFDPQNNYHSCVVKQPSRHTCALQMNKLQEIKEQSPQHENETKKGEVSDKLPNASLTNLDDAEGREEIDEENRASTKYYEEQVQELDFTFTIHQEVANILQKDDLDNTFLTVTPNPDDLKKFAEENVLSLCGLTSPINFGQAYSKEFLTNCIKIGEGIFGEVFCYMPHPFKQKIALKIIPIEGGRLVNFSPQKTYSEVFSEMCIAFSLSSLKNVSNNNNYTDGFCSLLRMTCLKGKYPDELIAKWNEYHRTRGSENDSPVVFDSDQLYIGLEMIHGGEPLESYKFSSARQSYSILLQVIYSLAVAEKSFEFEHRDLHWGNVLVSNTYKKKIKYIIDGADYYLSSYGKKSTIIDYTLSRIRSGNFNIYNDLEADDELFEAYGDYQFDVYRGMRDDVENNWKLYVPKSNVRWIHYLAKKCCKEVHYKTNHNLHKSYLLKIKCLKDKVMSYSSASDIVKYLKTSKIV